VPDSIIAYPFPHLILYPAIDDYESLEEAYLSSETVASTGLKINTVPQSEFSWKQRLAGRLEGIFGVRGTPTIGRFMFRRAGYRLLPHIDPPNFLLTVIHYMPLEGQPDSSGTVLYSAEWPVHHSSSGAEYWDGGCEAEKVVPYRKNLALAFLNTPYSAHGLEPLAEDRLAYQWHLTA
jgi:hypothetical protein